MEILYVLVISIPILIFAGLFFGTLFGLDLLGQKIFKVPEGEGALIFVVIIFIFGVGPVFGLASIILGHMQGAEAIILAIMYLAIFKFVWWDNFFSSKNKKCGVDDIAQPIIHSKQIQTSPPKANRWVYNKKTGVLANRVTGEIYKGSEIKWVEGPAVGFEILHGKTPWVNSYETDFE